MGAWHGVVTCVLHRPARLPNGPTHHGMSNMAILLQQPTGIEGWMKILIPIVIVAASVLRPVAKWLIAKTSPGKEEEPKAILGDRGAGKPPAPRGRVPSARPVARPMPTPGQRGEAAAQPHAPLARDSQVAPSTAGGARRDPRTGVPTARPTVSQEQGPATPVIPPPPRVTPRRPPARPAPPPAKRPPAQVARSQGRISVKPKESKLRHLQPTLDATLGEEEDTKFAKRARELGTLRVERTAELVPEVVHGEFDPIRNPTRRWLRQAILMREILGPPLALRPPDDRL